MSRIDEALKQAGRTSRHEAAEELSGLETFPATTPEPLERTLEETPLDTPAIDAERSPLALTGWHSERLVIDTNVRPVVIEQYRRLAAALHQAQVERGIKVVMFASAQAAEGKTLTASNLALTLSESYRRRVLLIDADLRRPTLGSIFAAEASFGLSECLKSAQLQPLRLSHITESLAVLLAGRPDNDPMAGLTSGRMQEILEQAGESFDWVILDTPPVELLSDTHLLVAMVDAAVLVIDAGKTQHPVVQRAVESIGREKIVGVVLNRVDDSALSDGAYYEYYGAGSRERRRRRYLAQEAMAPEISR
jgi:capsular exopolysaccharide synthesis family protein